MISHRVLNAVFIFLVAIILTLAQLIGSTDVKAADRAVQIAKQSRDRIESSGSLLKESSRTMFSEFAVRTGELQKLLDTRERLEKAGMLSKDDPEGKTRRANINARIILEVGKLKDVCDQNIDPLLLSLESFDSAIAESIVDTQATRSINDNHELNIKNYKKTELARFNQAAATAENLLDRIRTADDPMMKKRLLAKYNRVKNRIRQIKQRRVLYESRLKIAAMNQRLSEKTREKIREHGENIPQKFINVISNLNYAFNKIIPVAETGGTGFADSLSSIGFSNLKELSNTLDIVSASTDKLDGVLNDMVNDVLEGLDGIKTVDDDNVTTGGAISYEKEIEFIGKERAAWSQG
ncbi:hypothetical protein [Desulfobacula phenolica]|uniref:Uncharacterized protein n=1 Tax=Desulfobacula phenolica TaxID=90732 RepID=A0A1H2JLZ9_9BACT|nr:hypothetical protein [Desulfobacula phenolica]SDU57085.1 hypothetical protein SAMN04487931_11364 [Desulfobacula phenolica]